MNVLRDAALHAFGLDSAEAVFLQHNENLTFRVDGQYLLRIHRAADGVHADHAPDVRRAELALLRHLADMGMPVQRPIAEATLPDDTLATLLTWLPGKSLVRDDMNPAVLLRAGALTFQLHQATLGFAHEGLRTYGAVHVRKLGEAIRAMSSRYALNADDIASACAACDVIGERLDEACSDFRAIHADLSASNLLQTDAGLAVIDFSLCGVGHPMHDLGILMGNTGSQAQRQAIKAGYTEAGGSIDLSLLDAGLTLGLLEALVFHADTWPKEPWFAPRLTRWANEMLRPLAEGKPLLNEEMFLLNLK